MSRVYFISDLHLGHKGTLNWARDYREGNNVLEMNQWMVTQINSVVREEDILYILGDVCFEMEDLRYLNQIPCTKKLILGNHDRFDLNVYQRYFDWVGAYKKYKGFWLSHMPIHEYDMLNTRVRGNIHGHLHQHTIDDPRYTNVSVEQCNGVPILFDDILKKHEQGVGGK